MTKTARRLVIPTLTLALCAALAGCTFTSAPKPSPTKTAAETGAGRKLTTAEAKAILPTADEVGTGWNAGTDSAFVSTDVLDSAVFTPTSCAFSSTDGSLTQVPLVEGSPKPAAEADATFSLPATTSKSPSLDVHAVTVTVKSYAKTVDASRIDAVTARLAQCSTFTAGESAGLTAQFAVKDVSEPAYGTRSLSFGLSGSISVLTLLVNSLQIVDGHTVISISQVGVDTIDAALADRVATAVMAKLAALN